MDLVLQIYNLDKDISLLSYTMDAVLDNTSVSLSYRDEVLNFLFPLFPPLEAKSPHIHAVTRLLVTLSNVKLTVPLLCQLVPKEKLLAYQLAFDLAEGGSQDFLESIRAELPEGDAVSLRRQKLLKEFSDCCVGHERNVRQYTLNFDRSRVCKVMPNILEEEQQSGHAHSQEHEGRLLLFTFIRLMLI